MSPQEIQLEWEKTSEEKFNNMINRMPLFHREIAKDVVEKKAVSNAKDRGAPCVQEDDIVQAFLSEVPKAFYSLMIRLFDEVGFAHQEYDQK